MKQSRQAFLEGSRVYLALQIAGAYTIGWLVPLIADLLLSVPLGLATLAGTLEPMAEMLRLTHICGCWIVAVVAGAYPTARFAGSKPIPSAIAAALGGMSALIAPFLFYGLPFPLLASFWMEGLMLGVWLPLAIMLFAANGRSSPL